MRGAWINDLAALRTASMRWLGCCATASCLGLTAMAAETRTADKLPSFAELQAAGAIVGEVRIVVNDIFDLDDPDENNFLFRLANKLHIRTKPGVIERSLLFNSGEPLSVQKIAESERLLRSNRFFYDVKIRPIAYHDGIVDIEVQTRDTWTIEPGVRFTRAGGSNSTGLTIREGNLLGTGTSIGYATSSDVDRNGTEFSLAQDHIFGGWTGVSLNIGNYSDGKSRAFSFGQPFYSLNTRWAGGASMQHDERIESIYQAGEIVGQYRHAQEKSSAYAGWSRGLVDGWTHRYSLGLSYQLDDYLIDPTLPAPRSVPVDQTLLSPYVRYDVIEDDYAVVRNRNKIHRAEFFAFGFSSSVQVGRALTELGSTRDLWTYSVTVTDGIKAARGNDLLLAANFSGQYGDGRVERQFLGGSVRYFVPHGKRAVFYAAASADKVRNPEDTDLLLLGGDNGLRGYPLRYQSGERRALFTIEERVYTNWYPFRLFRVGGAVFFDVGRAWGGPYQNQSNGGWLSDAGFGLRVISDRASFGNVIHADIAFPLNTDANIDSIQFLFKSYTNF